MKVINFKTNFINVHLVLFIGWTFLVVYFFYSIINYEINNKSFFSLLRFFRNKDFQSATCLRKPNEISSHSISRWYKHILADINTAQDISFLSSLQSLGDTSVIENLTIHILYSFKMFYIYFLPFLSFLYTPRI